MEVGVVSYSRVILCFEAMVSSRIGMDKTRRRGLLRLPRSLLFENVLRCSWSRPTALTPPSVPFLSGDDDDDDVVEKACGR